MNVLRILWKGREIVYVGAILFLGRGWLGALDRSPDSVSPGASESQPVVVRDSGELAGTTVEEARRADKPRGVIERVGTKEVRPDSVLVSRPVIREGGAGVPEDGPDGMVSPPTRVPSVPIEIPEWGIQDVEKEGPKLTVASLNRRDGSVVRQVYTLGGGDADFTIRSGNVPAAVREDREFRVLRLGIRGTAFGGVVQGSGAPSVGGILQGPVSVGSDRLRATPAVIVGFGEGTRIGGTLTAEVGEL